MLLQLVHAQKIFIAKLFAANFAERVGVDHAHLPQLVRRERAFGATVVLACRTACRQRVGYIGDVWDIWDEFTGLEK